MFDEFLLADKFTNLLEQTRKTERLYAELETEEDNPQKRETIRLLHAEKSRQVRLAERLVEIVE